MPIVVEYCSGRSQAINAFRIGCAPPIRSDLRERAEELAVASDAVVLVVGTTPEWESEGFDRDSLRLASPPQDDLIHGVRACNPRTVVVINTGSPIGDELGGPGSRRAASVVRRPGNGSRGRRCPRRRHRPGWSTAGHHPNVHGAHTRVRQLPGDGDNIVYGERLLVGYKWYEGRGLRVRFPFGHGLSYTSFTIDGPGLLRSTWSAGGYSRSRWP